MPNFYLSVEVFNCTLYKLLPEIWLPKSTHLGADCVILPELKKAAERALCFLPLPCYNNKSTLSISFRKELTHTSSA